MNYQWYPGHMTKAKRMMEEDIRLVDLVMELIDARAPISSRNPDIDNLAKNKLRLVLLNKADLADQNVTAAWMEEFKQKGIETVVLNAQRGTGMNDVRIAVRKVCEAKFERDRKRGILNRPVRAMVVGIPNVGKSTFINSYAKKACTKTGNKPGVTKGKQWIRLDKTLELLDTPGILWPKFEDQTTGMHLAMLGTMNDEVLIKEELCCDIIRFLQKSYPGLLERRYQAEAGSAEEVFRMIAINRGCIQKGEQPDLMKASSMLLEEFRSGKIGHITLERP